MSGKNNLFLTLSKTCGRVSSQQGAPTTCNLTHGKASQQTFVRTLMATLGVVIGQYSDVQWGGGGGGGIAVGQWLWRTGAIHPVRFPST